ncbi:sugar phosphate isomerase/epimerase [Phycicoccus endophyticus]|uniref:Sugar phosphate isomerase/epimerase n=1 Tax=Phycicoccus endophyticus TaxID=1690220 RepID=A0A7G9R2A5_9MICO|nr:sugar phosphate isomerase/epimerase family protein [Phycicoccus endophyticus]NHI19604.1 sugar phosphate isomerase/epimerase [Phycicoccus endophyticus]QNN49730.1 sugar phosphate isomerase/epimerase [Phycicoccus endophyticus]GGL34551.1 epimerase [Phycicoccus endophyticus]
MNNLLGVHALVWVGDTGPESVSTAIAQTRAAGFGLLEFSLHDAVSFDLDRTRAELATAGLAAAASRGLSPDADVSSEDPHVVRRGEELLHESLRVTAGFGGTWLTGALYSAFGHARGPLSEAGRRNIVSVLRDLAKDAEELGVTLGLEVCNRYETNVVNTARDALRLADDIGADNVRIHLDTYHMNIEEDDLVRPVHDVGDRLGYVHVGENHRGYLGSGHLDFTGFFHALADIGYDGPVTFESFSSSVIAPGLSTDLAIWRNLWDDGFDLASHARDFLDRGLQAARRR